MRTEKGGLAPLKSGIQHGLFNNGSRQLPLLYLLFRSQNTTLFKESFCATP
jgi:hypothetical protein